MSAVPKTLLTPEQYLARESAADFKSEFFAGEMFAMAGGSPDHALIAGNLIRELGNALKRGPCRVRGSDLRVKVGATGLYTYPDVSVVCGELRTEDRRHDTLLNPTLIIEVLSDGTEKYDRTVKFDHYRKLDSLQEYALVSQHEARVERYVRQAEGSWALTVHEGLDAAAAFASVGASVPLAEIYFGVELPPPGPLRG
jgi:Uma2 family endonuclease